MPDGGDVLHHIGAPGDDASRRVLRGRRVLYGATSAVLAGIMLLAVLDALDVVDTYGVETSRVSADGGGYALEVHYGTISRPGVATPFDIVVRRPGGFDGPVTVAVDRHYLRMWDENGVTPAPSAETTLGPWLVWEFDPPSDEVLHITLDARIEPAAQEGATGRVAVLEEDAPVVDVEFRTRIRP